MAATAAVAPPLEAAAAAVAATLVLASKVLAKCLVIEIHLVTHRRVIFVRRSSPSPDVPLAALLE